MTPYLHFFSKIFGHVKKKQYLCTRFSKISDSRLLWGPRKFLIFGESEKATKIPMSNFVANRIESRLARSLPSSVGRATDS